MQWPLLDSLGDDERRRVLSSARRHRFARGEVLFHEGNPASSLHVLVAGRLAVSVSTVTQRCSTC